MYIRTDWKVSMHSVHRGRLHSTRDAPDVTTHMAITPIFPYREETPRARGKQTTDAIRLDTTQFIRHPVCTCTTCVCVYMHVCVSILSGLCIAKRSLPRNLFISLSREDYPEIMRLQHIFFPCAPKGDKVIMC